MSAPFWDWARAEGEPDATWIISRAEARKLIEPQPPPQIFLVYSPGDPVAITTCTTPEAARRYCAALALLPEGHFLRTTDAVVEPVPLLSELPAPLLELEAMAARVRGEGT